MSTLKGYVDSERALEIAGNIFEPGFDPSQADFAAVDLTVIRNNSNEVLLAPTGRFFVSGIRRCRLVSVTETRHSYDAIFSPADRFSKLDMGYNIAELFLDGCLEVDLVRGGRKRVDNSWLSISPNQIDTDPRYKFRTDQYATHRRLDQATTGEVRS